MSDTCCPQYTVASATKSNFFIILMEKMLIVQDKMVLELREREHEDMDRVEMGNSMTLNSL